MYHWELYIEKWYYDGGVRFLAIEHHSVATLPQLLNDPEVNRMTLVKETRQ